MAATAASLKVEVPELARERCLPAPLPPPPNPSEAEKDAFAVLQTGALENCDTKRALAVAAADHHNQWVERMADDIRPRGVLDVFSARAPLPEKPSLNDVLNARN